MDSKKETEISQVVQRFHSSLSKILKMFDTKYPDNLDVDRLKRIIRIARDEEPLFIINRCKDKFWYAREHILARNEKFFLENEYDQFIKKDENQSFIETLVTLVKDSYRGLDKEELDYIWKCNNDMLTCITEFKLLIEDHI